MDSQCSVSEFLWNGASVRVLGYYTWDPWFNRQHGGKGGRKGRRKKRQMVQEKMLYTMVVLSATLEAGPGGLLQFVNLRPA